MTSPWLPAASFVVGVVLALALHGGPARVHGAAGATSAAAGVPRIIGLQGEARDEGEIRHRFSASRRRILAPARLAMNLAREPPPLRTRAAPNLDPDALDPRLRREHLRLLAAEPFLQRLPYRDPVIGVALVNSTPQGAPVLLVTFIGGVAAARRDVLAALANAHDPGTEYALRYERLSR